MSCNTNYYDLDDAFHDLGSIEWQIRSNIQKGDVCYIYVGHSDRAVRYKCIAVSEIRDKTTIDDRLYGGNPIGIPYKCIEIKPIGYYVGEGIKYDELKERGLNFSIRGQIKLKDEWGKYIRDFKFTECLFNDSCNSIDYSSDARQIEKEIDELNIDGKTKEKLVKVRVNQGIFRDRLLTRYNKCCLCNVNNRQLLVASHIKPWSDCEDSEKLLVDNGFLLCPNHDSLFDKGLISFDDDGTIIISSKMDAVNRMFMNVKEGMKIKVVEENIPFLRYHRENIFEK